MCSKMDVTVSTLTWIISHTELLIQENIAHFGGGDNCWLEKKISFLNWEDFLLINHVILVVLTVDCTSGELNSSWAD